jgi:glycosyltransferase involved in cell wall biosynthesis
MPNNHAPSVVVLMSVFNGSRYLREQIDSILSQVRVKVILQVWDDGSTDDTREILDSYGEDLTYWTGENHGAAQGFLQAVGLCNATAPYYAFSDADDVWLPTKLIDAITELEDHKILGPALIATKMTLTDSDLNPIGETAQPTIPFSFENALVQGAIGGASCVINSDLWQIFKSQRPTTLVMHDGWLYLVATAFGQIIFSSKSGILYRQHNSNVMGARHGIKARWVRRLKWIASKGDKQKDQAREFLRLFGDRLSLQQRRTAEIFAFHDRSPGSRIRFAIAPPVIFNSARSRALYTLRAALART